MNILIVPCLCLAAMASLYLAAPLSRLCALLCLGIGGSLLGGRSRAVLSMMLIIACGALIGGTARAGLQGSRPRAGMAFDAARTWEVSLVEDATIAAGRTRCRVRLLRIGDGRGTSASACGIVTLVVAGAERMHRWERYSISPARLEYRGETGIYELRAGGSSGLKRIEHEGLMEVMVRARRTALAAVLDGSRGLGAAGGLYAALVFGLRDQADPALVRSFRGAGISHLLALSGMHLSIIEALLYAVLVPILGRRRLFFLVYPMLLLYGLLTGVKPSIVRALFMCGYAGAAALIGRPVSMAHSLCLSLLAGMLLTPQEAMSAAFILTHAAVAGIVVIAPLARRALSVYLPESAAAVLSVSLGAQAATFPVTAALFGTAQPLAFVGSIAIGSLSGLYMVVGLGAAALQPFAPLALPLSKILDLLYTVIVRLATGLSALPSLAFAEGGPWAAAGCLLCCILGCFRLREVNDSLQLAVAAARRARGTGPGAEEAVRPEFPDQRSGSGQDRSGPRPP